MVTATYHLTQAGWPGVAVVEKAGLENYTLNLTKRIYAT